MTRRKTQIGLAVLAMAALFGVGQWLHALQGPQRPGPGGSMGGPMGGSGFPRLQQLARQLDLTDSQRTQIKSILESARAQVQALRSNMNITKQQELDQLRQIQQDTQSRIRAELTPDQQAKADQLRQQAQERIADRQEKMQERMLTRLTGELSLSASQESLIKSYLADQKSQLQAVRNNASLTPAQKLEQAKSIHQQTQEQIKSALTSEQQAQLEQLQQRMNDRNRRRHRRGGPFGGPGPGGMHGPAGFMNQGVSL